MKIARCLPILALALGLSGCMGDHRGKQNVQQDGAGLGFMRPQPAKFPLAERVEVEPYSTGTLAALEKIHSDSQASQNATQQSLTGLGLQFGKVAERFDAALAKIEANLQLTIHNSATANASVSATAMAELRGEIKDIHAEITGLKLTIGKMEVSNAAMAAGQVALNARMDQTTNNLNAGRDNVQFTKEMAGVFETAFEKMTEALLAAVGIVVGVVTAATTIVVGTVALLTRSQTKSTHELVRETLGVVKVIAHLSVFKHEPKENVHAKAA